MDTEGVILLKVNICKFRFVSGMHTYCTFFLKKKVRPAWADPVRLIEPHWCNSCTAKSPKKEMK